MNNPQFANIQNNALNNFRRLMTMGRNPIELQQMILQQNPQLRIIANQMQQSGLTPSQYILQIAKQNNLPINEYMVNGLMNSLMGLIPRQ